MPAKDFKFISPGVFINEIDNSQLPREAGDIGPAIIGRAQQGPGLVPTQVNSFSEFVEIFGPPSPGGQSADVSREGGNDGPTYGGYAAQAWLRNNSPVTFVRLVGQQNSDAVSGEGEAGWQTTNTDASASPTQGGAYGLFVFESGSAQSDIANVTASLAAVWYCNTGSVALSGTVMTGSEGAGPELVVDNLGRATGKFVKCSANREFKVVIRGDQGATEIESRFNFNNTSENFIRKVFNTNPTLTNSAITLTSAEGYADYWLGETYEDEVKTILGATGIDQYGVILPLQRGTTTGGSFRKDYEDATTGFFFSQDFGNSPENFNAREQEQLFRLRARNTGRWSSKNLKISISDIRASSDPAEAYGTFSVLVRAMSDDDNRLKILEQFNNCNLNPSSPNFLARKIGDKFIEWDDTDRRYKEYGDYENLSDYVYVDLTTSVRENKHNPESLPFGVLGPPTFVPVSASDIGTIRTLVSGGQDLSQGNTGSMFIPPTVVSGGQFYPVQLKFPELRLRVSASEGNPTDPTAVFFGVDSTFNLGRPSDTIGDYTGPKPFGISSRDTQDAGDAHTTEMFVFTLDDMTVVQSDGDVALSGTLVYESGSRQNGGSTGKINIRRAEIDGDSYRKILDLGADRFTTVLHGGFDGLDITEQEPFRNTGLAGSSERDNYAFNSIKVAIDSLRDPEVVEYDLLSVPGLTNATLNRNLIDMAEQRGDALAVVDLDGGYVPTTEGTQTAQQRLGSVKTTITNKRQNLQINSSFGAAYYPWVQIQDTINGSILWAPPSVAAIGAMSYGQRTQALWFAPAGFTRGGLSANDAAGIPVVGVRERLIARDRDRLYEANINPIAQFPSEGIVIFGQKTFQATPSALDRINVRRLLIFLKKQISRFASTIMFDQNVDVTWNRFTSQVEPFLASVKAGLGLEEYRLILDDSTTTPDLVDRNVVYAKIFLKPARSIEFIAIDFVITDSGAAFED